MRSFIQEYIVASQYFAPKDQERLMFLGEQIALRHLHYDDRLIGIVGDSGSGKSSLIKGMFPGLELTNDDNVINTRKIMNIRDAFSEMTDATTFHIDIRFTQAFMQMYEIADYINILLDNHRRVIIEHFDLIYPLLQKNSDILIGIGEEIIVTRPTLFGPLPDSIYRIVHNSLIYRKMAHTAEEIAVMLLNRDLVDVTTEDYYFSDIRNGFVINYKKKPNIDFDALEKEILDIINQKLPVSYYDEGHVMIGENKLTCSAPRLHVRNTSEITEFHLMKDFVYDERSKTYCLIGLVDEYADNINNRNTEYFLIRDCRTNENN